MSTFICTKCGAVENTATSNYREVPLNTIIGATAALIYFLSPVDVIPDVVAGLGQIDDIAILGFAIKSISHDLDRYSSWKNGEITKEVADKMIDTARVASSVTTMTHHYFVE